jgi:Skp family chaperone for outer membrane proteins
MKIRLLLTLPIVLVAVSSVFAQTGGAAGGQGAKPPVGAPGGQVPKMKIAIVDVLAFREQVGELKAKYDKLQTEFAPRYQQLESLKTKLAAQEKTLTENKSLTPQQAAKLNEEYEQGKKDYQRTLEDSQTIARKREQEETEAIYDKLSKYLDQYCTKHGITHVFDARRLQETGLVVYAAPLANITNDFVKEYNKAYPSPAKP